MLTLAFSVELILELDGQTAPVHDSIRQEMHTVLDEHEALPWLDGISRERFAEARQSFDSFELDWRQWLETVMNPRPPIWQTPCRAADRRTPESAM